MLKFEIKKVLAGTGSRIALLILLFTLGLTCWLAVGGVDFVNEKGVTETGVAAAGKLRAAQKEWAGVLDEEKIEKVILENARINATDEARSANVEQNNIAYGWKQGFSNIRSLLNYAYADAFREYDYYRADSLTVEDAVHFYENRIRLLREWLETEAKDQFTEAQKEWLLARYESLPTPLYYDYLKGWSQLFEYFQMLVMILVLVLGYLTAGIFSGEFTRRADAVFFSSYHGRKRAVAAKVGAGFMLVTGLYWGMVLIYTGVVLLCLGADGAGCRIQVLWENWKSFYAITIRQEYLLVAVGGYVGSLFLSFLTMLVSARTKSAVVAVLVPFVAIFLPSFIGGINSAFLTKVMGLLPDRLLQLGVAIGYFDLYQIGGRVTGAVPVLLVLYGALTAGLIPAVYGVYRRL